MGAKGVGKTTFIDAFKSKFSSGEFGHFYLDPNRKDVEAHVALMTNDRRLTLIDIPGFDGPQTSNAEILQCIQSFLTQRYRNSRPIDGLIYLHRITDIRFDARAATALNIFRKLYHSDGYDKLGLVTTMWNDIKPDLKYKYEAKETELKETSWGTFLKRDDAAVLARFDSSVEDGGKADSLKVIEELAKRSLQNQLILELQREMVDEKIRLPMTQAGKAAFLLAEIAKYYLQEITS
ncbi:hypothetical protein BJ165DRAFT_180965 [Panaeolus papilionaceus]|nr:hypothetical protein BJ165DRAFT_180965 [Panaeolus papilionaceus]